jgi:hypothetical protein
MVGIVFTYPRALFHLAQGLSQRFTHLIHRKTGISILAFAKDLSRPLQAFSAMRKVRGSPMKKRIMRAVNHLVDILLGHFFMATDLFSGCRID